MTTTIPTKLLHRIVDAYDSLKAAELDHPATELEPFRAALAAAVGELEALTGRRKARGPDAPGRPVPPSGGWY